MLSSTLATIPVRVCAPRESLLRRYLVYCTGGTENQTLASLLDPWLPRYSPAPEQVAEGICSGGDDGERVLPRSFGRAMARQDEFWAPERKSRMSGIELRARNQFSFLFLTVPALADRNHEIKCRVFSFFRFSCSPLVWSCELKMSMAAENATLSLVMPNRIGTRARGRLTSCGSWDCMIHPGSSRYQISETCICRAHKSAYCGRV